MRPYSGALVLIAALSAAAPSLAEDATLAPPAEREAAGAPASGPAAAPAPAEGTATASLTPRGTADRDILKMSVSDLEVLGPHDLLEITVFDLEQFSRTVRVSEDGSITLTVDPETDLTRPQEKLGRWSA